MEQFTDLSPLELLLVLPLVLIMVGDASGETLCCDNATGDGERAGEESAFDANEADDDREETEDDTLCVDGGDEGIGEEEPAEDKAA